MPKKISEDDDASNDESGDKEPKQGKGKKMKPPKKTKSSTMTKVLPAFDFFNTHYPITCLSCLIMFYISSLL